MTDPEFDIAVSFAGEDRAIVDEVVRMLQDAGVHVFYDIDQRAQLWGKDLAEELEQTYRHRAFRTLMFISSHYAEKAWPTHERRSAMARAISHPKEPYVLPVRLDDTEVPGLPSTIAYFDARDGVAATIVEITLTHLLASGRKLGLLPEEFQERSREPRKVSVSSTVAEQDDGWYVTFRIVNGSDYQIHTAVLVVDDPGVKGNPADQTGTALELVIGTMPPGHTEQGRYQVMLTEEPPFASITYMCTLLFTDSWGQNWATDGTRTWRRPLPARVC